MFGRQETPILNRFFLISALGLGFSVSPQAKVEKRSPASTQKKSSTKKTNTPKTSSTQTKRQLDVSGLTSLKTESPAKKSKEAEKKKPKKLDESEIGPKGLLNVPAEEIVETLKGINLLLSKKPGEQERIKLQMNRAMSTYSLARRRLIDSKDKKADATTKRLLAVANKDALAVSKIPNLSEQMRARSLYIAGLPLILLERMPEARNLFIEALSIDPRSENAGWMALFVGEDFFERENFHEAIPYYSNYWGVMDDREVEISKYKLAWTYLNLENPSRARQLFIELIRKNPKEGFGKDSIKDLAYVVTTYNSESEILRITDEVFGDKEPQMTIDFLSTVMANLEIQNQVTLQSQILARLLVLEKDPVKKLQYLLAGVRTARKEYASIQHFKAFGQIRAFMEKEGLEGGKKNFEAVRSSLDLESQNVIKAYVETFAGRTKTPEKLTRNQIAINLKELFGFYEKHFSEAKTFIPVLKLWLDVCIDTSDWACVDSVAEKILAKKEMQAQHQRSFFEQIVALDRLNTENPKNWESKFEKRLEDFVGTQETAPQWLDLSKRLSQIYIKNKDYKKAVTLAEKVFTKDPSADAHYRLQWTRFEAGLYADVVAEKRKPKTEPVDPKSIDLQRESALKIAIEARKSDNFEEYTKAIKFFLALNPTPAKAMTARKDYFLYMLEKDYLAQLTAEMRTLPPEIRFSKDLSEVLELGWVKAMRLGKFQEAVSLTTSPVKTFKVGQQNQSRSFMGKLALGQSPSFDDFKLLSFDSRLYVIGTLALAKPDLALFYLSQETPVKNKQLRSLAALAFRIQSGDWSVVRTAKTARILGDNYPFTEGKNLSPLPVEALIKKVVIPVKPINNQRTLARYTEDIVFQTRRARKRVPKEIARKPLEVQIRTVNAARTLETRVADFLKAQPAPRELTGAQIDEYQKAIAEVAKEFIDQAVEFEKLGKSLEEAKLKSDIELAQRQLPMPDMTRWEWPSAFRGDALAALKQTYENHNYLGTLLMMDLHRNEALKEPLDYYRVRSGVLVSISDNPALRRYVLEELEQSNQAETIASWKKLVADKIQLPEAAIEEDLDETAN